MSPRKEPDTYSSFVTRLTFRVVSVFCAAILLFSVASWGQEKDTTTIYLNADNMFFQKSDSGSITSFVGNAVFRDGTDTLYCDSLHENKSKKIIEAFGNVRMVQKGGTEGTSNYLRYHTSTKTAFMQGDVYLTDGANNLDCDRLTYDLGSKIGVYDNGGTLHNDSTTISSTTGTYSVNNKDARFKGKVLVVDPKYIIHSEDMQYNTETKVTEFYARSTVTSDSGKSILQTNGGTYDGKNVVAHFTGHSSIWNDGQYIEGDSLYYNKATSYGLAIGNVISIDTAHKSTMYCGRAEYFQKKRVLWATEKPVLVQVNGKDTLYMRADTFYSAPMLGIHHKKTTTKPTAGADSLTVNSDSSKTILATNNLEETDTIKPKKTYPMWAEKTTKNSKIKGADSAITPIVLPEEIVWIVPAEKFRIPRQEIGASGLITDTTVAKPPKAVSKKAIKVPIILTDTVEADSSAPQYFIGYHHVLIFSDSLQGKCDSLCYSRSDSTVRMITDPIAWSHNSQITGDTILMQLDSNTLRSMYVPNNAFVASQSGPVQAGLFDQIQGKTLTAYFKKSTISKMDVLPDAESIYYSKDDDGAYIGVNQAKSEEMFIFFDDQRITRIKFERDVHQTMTPLEKADLPETKLSRFKWLIEMRPKTKEELFD